VAQLPTIFKQVAMSLDWMEDYTGVPYPFAKYDFIILPGFQYGGMEHTGATLYNDTRMFLSKNPTPDEELRRAALIAHETAHMWFGDFVTMKWFDDVWTKEVFASYFGQKITEPMFPEINHQLNWLKSITTSALGEDRTLGGTAIKQPLDNLSSAGLVYNNIIYNKAPVMLKKLVEIMGEEAFRAGIHDYLVAYSYGNATWDDLVKILDSKTGADLVSFSDVWVNSNGMPWLTFSLEDDTLTVSQSDPYGRGLLWPQSFKVSLDTFKIAALQIEKRVFEIVMDKETVKIPVGKNMMLLNGLNSDGRGYGYFRFSNPHYLNFAVNNWWRIKDEVFVQSQLMNLFEAFQHGELPAQTLLENLMMGLMQEGEVKYIAMQNPLIASTVCNYISALLPEVQDGQLEMWLLEMSQDHPIASCRQQLLRALISNASDSLVWKELHSIWSEASHPLLSENDYMTLAWELAIRNPQQHQEIIAAQSARILNPDRKRQFEFISRATTPDVAAQEQLFRSLLQAENRRVEPWALKTLSYLCHPLREEQAVKYIRPALDSLPYIQRTSDIFFPMNWTRTLLGRFRSPDALEEVEKFLADNPDFPPLLKSKVLQASWSLQRRNKAN
jgi:aminopeptidase N